MNPSVAQEKYVYLTTRGRKTGRPHTVELWFAVVDGSIYLSHEGTYTDWMKNLIKDSCAIFMVRGDRYAGEARILKAGESFEKGKHALYKKYIGDASSDVVDDWFSESTIVEVYCVKCSRTSTAASSGLRKALL